MNVRIKKTNNEAIIPTYGSDEAAGCDLYAMIENEINIAPGETVKIPTGVCMEIQPGYFGGVYARSGIATKRGLRPANCTGVIDSDYRGEIIVALHNDSDEVQTICKHERVAQMIFQKYEKADFMIVDDLADTTRGAGGFGSTGK